MNPFMSKQMQRPNYILILYVDLSADSQIWLERRYETRPMVSSSKFVSILKKESLPMRKSRFVAHIVQETKINYKIVLFAGLSSSPTVSLQHQPVSTGYHLGWVKWIISNDSLATEFFENVDKTEEVH